MEYTYVEEDQHPFVQKIVDRLYKAVDAENPVVSRAAIWYLPPFLQNASIRNKTYIISSLQEKLKDKNWKTRFVAHNSLKFENLLPEGHRLKFTDKVLAKLWGNPNDF